jgi:hypothetical protein
VNILSALITNPKPAELGPPSMGPFHHPTMSSKALFRLDPLARDAGADATFPARTAAPGIVVAFVGMQLVRTESGPTSGSGNGRNAIQQIVQNFGVMNVGGRQEHGQRNALSIDEKMVFRARFAFVRRVRAGFFAPFFAATVAESTAARLQSISPARPNFSKNTQCRRRQTPASCHSLSRRQQVIPLPQPISLGSISQGMPLRRTNRMPVRAARSDTRGRPPFGFGFSGGNKGATCSHSLSSSMGRILRPRITLNGFVRNSKRCKPRGECADPRSEWPSSRSEWRTARSGKPASRSERRGADGERPSSRSGRRTIRSGRLTSQGGRPPASIRGSCARSLSAW